MKGHAWGMTEMSPLGTICRLKSYMETLPVVDRYAIRAVTSFRSAPRGSRLTCPASRIRL